MAKKVTPKNLDEALLVIAELETAAISAEENLQAEKIAHKETKDLFKAEEENHFATKQKAAADLENVAATLKETKETANKQAAESAELIKELSSKIEKTERATPAGEVYEVNLKVPDEDKKLTVEKTFTFSKKLKAIHDGKIITAKEIFEDHELALSLLESGLLTEVTEA